VDGITALHTEADNWDQHIQQTDAGGGDDAADDLDGVDLEGLMGLPVENPEFVEGDAEYVAVTSTVIAAPLVALAKQAATSQVVSDANRLTVSQPAPGNGGEYIAVAGENNDEEGDGDGGSTMGKKGLSSIFKRRASHHASKMLHVVAEVQQQEARKRWNPTADNGKDRAKGRWVEMGKVPDDCWVDFAYEARMDEDC
jgi:hypothetical protein